MLTVEKRRLEYSIQATEGPLHIARDCLGNRQRRIDYDLVQDQAEKELGTSVFPAPLGNVSKQVAGGKVKHRAYCGPSPQCR